jgi:hypothetical protein
MKKIILTAAFAATALFSFAQVGVGTENPTTTLEVVGANATDTGTSGANTPGALAAGDGITVPVVTTDMRASESPTAGLKVGQLVYSTDADSTGFWHWTGTAWAQVGGAAAAPVVPARATSTNTISNADLGGFVVALVNVTFDLGQLTPVNGSTITFVDGGLGFSVSPATGNGTQTPTLPGGGISYVYVGTTWYAYNSF